MDAQAKVLIVWIAFAVGIIVTGSPFAAVIMAYICRDTNRVPGVAGHNKAQIRLFWWGFLGWMIAIGVIALGIANGISNDLDDPPMLFWIGFLLAFLVQIAFTIMSIIGIVRAAQKKNWPGSDADKLPTEVFG